MHMPKYRVMHPWGRDQGRQATLLSEHATIAEVFAAIDAFVAQAVRTGARAMRSNWSSPTSTAT